MIAVARRGTRQESQIAVTGRVDESGGLKSMCTAVIVKPEVADRVPIAACIGHKAVEQDIDACFRAEFIERQLHGFGIKHDENAAMPQRRSHGAEPAQFLKEGIRYAEDSLARFRA
jgi:hypothetical protein